MSTRSLRVTLGSTSPRNLSDLDGDAVFAAYVGEQLTLAFLEPLARDAAGSLVHSANVSVTRQPSGSALTFTAGAATPTHAGLHTLTVQNGGQPARTIRFVAYPSAALTHANVKEPNRQVLPERTVADPNPRSETTIRATLDAYSLNQAREGRDLTAFDALTTNAPLPASTDWTAFVPR